MPSRTADGADRRSSILTAARAIADDPLARFTMDEIAARAGITKATVYRYFDGKAAILVALRDGAATSDDQEDRRRRILDATLRCAARWGFRGATMNRIGWEAGVSAAAIYGYFPSKEHLIAELLETYTPLPQLRQLRELPIGAEDEQLRAILARIFEVLDERFDFIRTILSEGFSRPEMIRDFYREVSSKLIAELTAYVDRRVEAGVFRPGPSFARAVAFISPLFVYTFASRNLGDALPLSREAAIGEFVAIFLGGLRAPRTESALPTDLVSPEVEV